MLKRVLLPVDGSALSERALPYAALLAGAQGASVTLVRVLEPLPWFYWASSGYGYMPPETYTELMEGNLAEANDRLARERATLEAAGVSVATELLDGLAADAL